MDIEHVSDKVTLTELANKLFMYCDARQWKLLLDEVFASDIWVDMSSTGGDKPMRMEAKDVCEMWENGFIGLDSVHHQAGHYIISVESDTADIFAYAVATHYKRDAVKGHTRTFTGSYDLKALRGANGWRISQFKYNLKYISGNITME